MELTTQVKKKIEQYMRYSHKASKLRDEIDEWFASKGIDTVSTDNTDTNGGGAIQDIIIDAAQGMETTEKSIQMTIKLIEDNLP
ncbi:hypothetical protein GCM10023310_69910 [Paenibacillus vulneris]|uniref:Uncharacterized protein n=1 Tax=Paenibacillus vulneris TaxID=1133364 RepID=A0ABW3UIH2_9BACL